MNLRYYVNQLLRPHCLTCLRTYRRTVARILSAALIITLCLPALTGCKRAEDNSLVVLNYGKYIDRDVLDRFQKETGITVKYEEYESVEDMYAKYKAGSIDYDLICTSEYMIETLRKENELIPIDYNTLKNYDNIDPEIIEMSKCFDPSHEYTVPYFYGTVGILYNTTMVDGDTVKSWRALWNKDYDNQIVMINSQRDAFMIPLILNGCSINSTDRTELDAAFNMLCDEKELVYAYLQDEIYECMISGDAAMAVCFSGEAATGMEYNEDLAYVVPEEGSNVWIDAWFVPRTCRHYDAAMQFIDYLCDGENAMTNFEYVWYASPNLYVKENADEETLGDITVFPTEDIMDRCDIYTSYDDETLNYTTDLWKRLKAY